MRLIVLIISFLLPLPALCAGQNWEVCLDKADFSFSLDGFLGSVKVSKSSCKVKFAVLGGKGEKYEVDLCDPLIHIDHFPAIDTNISQRIIAGSASCPSPLFGADFEENAKDFNDYRDMRTKVFEIWNKVKNVYGADADKVNLSNPNSFSPEVSAGKIACGQYLLSEYLSNCMAFEAPKQVATEVDKAPDIRGLPSQTMPNIPGIHPQTIITPNK